MMNTYATPNAGLEYARALEYDRQHQPRSTFDTQRYGGVWNEFKTANKVGLATALPLWLAGEAYYQSHYTGELFESRLLSNFPRGGYALGKLAMVGGREAVAPAAKWAGRGLFKTVVGKPNPASFRFRTPAQHLAHIPHSIGGWFLPSAVNDKLFLSSSEQAFKSKGIRGGITGKIFGNALPPVFAAGMVASRWYGDKIPIGLAAGSVGMEAVAWGVGSGVGGALGAGINSAFGIASGSIAGTAIAGALPLIGALAATGLVMNETDKIIKTTHGMAGHKVGMAFSGINKPLFGEQTYTMRQQALMAIQRSPANDRMRVLGNEATIAHL